MLGKCPLISFNQLKLVEKRLAFRNVLQNGTQYGAYSFLCFSLSREHWKVINLVMV